MVRTGQDRIGGKPEAVVEADETYVGGRTRGLRGGASTIWSSWREPSKSDTAARTDSLNKRKTWRNGGARPVFRWCRRSAKSLVGFIEHAVAPRHLHYHR